jgi:hypothetical protein
MYQQKIFLLWANKGIGPEADLLLFEKNRDHVTRIAETKVYASLPLVTINY